MTVRLTTRTDPSRPGYAVIEASGEAVEGVGRRYVALHRLNAVAWGVIDGLDDDRAVHHRLPVPWVNSERNLAALSWADHGSVERRRQLARNDGEPDGSPPPAHVLADHGPPFGVPEGVRSD